MQILPLTLDQFAMVDDDVFDEVSKQNWHYVEAGRCRYAAKGVRRADGTKTKIFLHRFIFLLKGIEVSPECTVDHIDGNGLNNQMSNLRIATKAQNGYNVRKRPANSSGFRGVTYHKATKKYRATIDCNKKKYNIGSFKDPIEAAKARDAKAIELHGAFAYLNFPVNQPS
jgi:hypothetical protein